MGNNFSKEQQDENDQGERIIQQIIDFHTKRVNEAGITKDYETILSELKIAKYLLENIPAEGGLNLYQALVLDTILHCNYDVTSQISGNEIVTNNTIELFKVLIEIVKNYLTLFGEIELNKLPTRNYKTYKQSLEISYNSLAFFKRIRDAEHLKELEEIFNDLEQKKFLLEEKEDGNTGLTFYQKLILELLEKGTKLNQDIQEDNFIEWLSSKFEKYADLFEHIPRDQLPFDYINTKHLFKIKHESLLLTSKLKLAPNWSQIEEIIQLLKEFKAKNNYSIEYISNELFFYHDLLFITILKKALDIYNDTSENLSIEESIEFLEQLLDKIKFIDMTSTPDPTNEKWIEAISEYIIIIKQLEANHCYLIFKQIILSETQDMNAVLNLVNEKKDILESALTKKGELNLYQKIIIKALNKWSRNYDDIEEDKMIDFFNEMLVIQDSFKDYFKISGNIYLTSFASLYSSTKIDFDWALIEKMFHYEFKSEESLNLENFISIVKRQKYLLNEYEVLPLDKKIFFFDYSTKIFLIIAKNISSFKRNSNAFKKIIGELLKNMASISAKSYDIPQEIIDQDTVLGLANIKQFLQQKNLITFCGKVIHEAYCKDFRNDQIKLEIINLWLDYVHSNIEDEQYQEEQIYRTLRTMNFKALFLRDEYADGSSSTETIEEAEKIVKKFCKPTEDPKVRKANVALRVFTYFVSKNSSPIDGISKVLAKLESEMQIQFTIMLIESLKSNNVGEKIVSIIDNGLVHLLDNQYILISYLDAKNSISSDELYKVKAIHTNDLFEYVIIAKIYINNHLYEESKNQISSIFKLLERQEFEKEYILSVLRIVDYFRDMFIYHKDVSIDQAKIAFVESVYKKLHQLITFDNELKDHIHNRIIKMYVISGNVEKTISLMQEVAENRQEYKDCLDRIGSITSEEDILELLQSNTDLIVYQEVSSLRQLLETRKNTFPQRMIKVQLYAKTLVEQKLDIFYQQTPEKKQLISKPDINEINQKIQELKPKHLLTQKSSIVKTTHYHIDVTLVPGTTNIFKLEIQGRGIGGIDTKTIAQVLYDPAVLSYDTDVIGNKIISLLKKALSQSNIAEVGAYYCQQYDIRTANQFEIFHRGSSLELQKNSLDYMFDYNELALKNLLEIRLKSAIEEDEISKNIKVLEAEIVDIHYNSISTQTKIIAMSNRIMNIYNADKAIKHILIPILIPKNTLVYHWVGVAVTKEENKLSIAYLDSENYKDIVPLQTILTYNLQKLFPHLYVSFTQISLEQQKYNNCGLELIENFVFYLTKARVSQEEAPYLHNYLWLQKLIFDQIKLDRGFAEVPLISYSSVQSVNSLLDKKINAKNIPYQLARSAEAYINEVANQIDLNWEFKKWLYLKDIAKFDQIMQKYNIARSVDELKDLEPSFYSFSIDLEDKELERDVLFVANLKEKLNLPAGTKEIEYLKPFIYKLNIAIKVTDAAVDITRLFYIPTIENTQKTLMDVANIYSMHAGINGLSLIPIGYEAINKYLQLGLVKTLIHVGPQLVKTLGYMILPTIIASFGISYIGFSYSVGLTIYGGFNAIDNMKSLYNEFYQKDFNLNSNIAYQNIAEKLSTTCLQNLYDFSSKAKDYEKAAYKIKLEEKGEFGKKLYEYIYSRVIDEKYDLQNNSKSKQIKIMDYDYCIKIIEFKEEESDHYYCYNEEQEILDHIVIIGEAYIQKSVSL